MATAPALTSVAATDDINLSRNQNEEDGSNPSALTVHQASIATTAETADGEKRIVKKIKKKRRPARPQIDPSAVKTGQLPPQTGTTYNIWYNKWSGGDREDQYLSKTHAEGRCNIAKDSGYTRADSVPGSFFCLFFARGLCPKGHQCDYLHRLPTIHDLFNPNIDCFGRDKHSDYRDDMGGVGSFMRQNRTLYVGRIHVSDDIEEIVARHFTEWGQIERIRVLTARGVAFVTYTNEANSQFAKEAMNQQSLDHNEILNVRWATVDPNPMAQAREARKIEEQAAEAVRRALPAEFVAEIEGKDPAARKRKRIEGSFGLQGYEAPDEIRYARAATIADSNGTRLLTGAQDHDVATTGQDITSRTDAVVASQLQAESTTSVISQHESVEVTNSILSGSTLAAVKKGYSFHVAAKPPDDTFNQSSSSALVSYGSSSEDD